jgi:mannosyl-oligosaccharide glucosidase
LLWGTYRPGIYFGLRSRTTGTALVAGLMWTRAMADGRADSSTLRHKCEQDSLERYGFSEHDGRGFGRQPIVDSANGVVLTTSFVGTDGGGTGSPGWTVRIAGEPTGQRRKQHVFVYVAVDAEFADGLAAAGHFELAPTLDVQGPRGLHVRGRVDALGSFSLLAEARSLRTQPGGAGGTGGEALPIAVWGSVAPKHSHLTVEDVAMALVGHAGQPPRDDARTPASVAPGELDGIVQPSSQLLVFQLITDGSPFELDLAYVPGGCGDRGAGGAVEGQQRMEENHCSAIHAAWTGEALGAELSQRSAAFRARLVSSFGLRCDAGRQGGGERSTGGGCEPRRLGGRRLGEVELDFAAAALAAQLGSLGFFYGQTTVAAEAAGGEPERTPPAPLLAVVPSRPFFPRGFLWDEGFHMLLVGAWDEGIAGLGSRHAGHRGRGGAKRLVAAGGGASGPHTRMRMIRPSEPATNRANPLHPAARLSPFAAPDDVTAHWLGLMRPDGWIPREQILGAEAAARVPFEFLAQRRDHANPPTLLLGLQRQLDRIEQGAETRGEGEWGPASVAGGDPADARWLELMRKLWPRLSTWYAWLARTQAGALPFTYRWRGRDVADGRLNAMTLASGLDDFPRATVPTEGERHVDLLGWVAFFSRFMARLAARLGQSDEARRCGAARRASILAHEHRPLAPGRVQHPLWNLPATIVQLLMHAVQLRTGGPAAGRRFARVHALGAHAFAARWPMRLRPVLPTRPYPATSWCTCTWPARCPHRAPSTDPSPPTDLHQVRV